MQPHFQRHTSSKFANLPEVVDPSAYCMLNSQTPKLSNRLHPEEQPENAHSSEGGVHWEQGRLVWAVEDSAGLYLRGAHAPEQVLHVTQLVGLPARIKSLSLVSREELAAKVRPSCLAQSGFESGRQLALRQQPDPDTGQI